MGVPGCEDDVSPSVSHVPSYNDSSNQVAVGYVEDSLAVRAALEESLQAFSMKLVENSEFTAVYPQGWDS